MSLFSDIENVSFSLCSLMDSKAKGIQRAQPSLDNLPLEADDGATKSITDKGAGG